MLNTLIIIVSLFISESSWAADSHRVNNGVSVEITEHGTCRSVNNTSGKDIFIPTKTSGEWSSFYNNPPTGVAVSSCDLCPGVSTIGATCPNGAKYLGTFNYGGSIGVKKLLITPGGCTDSTTPTCADGIDTVEKRWKLSPQPTTAATSANDGVDNTNKAVTAGAGHDAAQYCYDMNYAGLTDWYLPARNEWNHVVSNMTALGASTFECQYWTSTETSDEQARYGGNNGGYCPGGTMGKDNLNSVRCILRY
jgi:hypothetical protein